MFAINYNYSIGNKVQHFKPPKFNKGWFILIPIEDPAKHEEYFLAIAKAMESLGIHIDMACKDVTRLRIISHDLNPYFAESAFIMNSLLNFKKPESIHDAVGNIGNNESDQFQGLRLWSRIFFPGKLILLKIMRIGVTLPLGWPTIWERPGANIFTRSAHFIRSIIRKRQIRIMIIV